MSTKSIRPVILVSACLVGCRARYDGTIPEVPDECLARWSAEGLVLPFCPETAGGLPVPRPPAEISGGSGQDVLDGQAGVFTRTGRDVTASFVDGARLALAAVRYFGLRAAVLKEGSPSCGTTRIYDGSFQGRREPGQGVAGALLAAGQVPLFNEHGLDRLETELAGKISSR